MSTSPLDEVFEDPDGPIRVDGAGRHAGQGFAGELVGDVEDLDRAAFSRLVEDVVQRPDLVGCDGGDRPRGPGAFFGGGDRFGHMEALVTPQPLDPLAVACPAVTDQQDVDAPIPVAGMTSGQGLQPCSQVSLVGHPRSAVALRGAVLAHARHARRSETPKRSRRRDTVACVAAPGSEVSPGDLPQHVDVELLVARGAA